MCKINKIIAYSPSEMIDEMLILWRSATLLKQNWELEGTTTLLGTLMQQPKGM